MTNNPLPLSLLNRDRFLGLFYDPTNFSINVKSDLHLHVLRIEDGSFVLEQLFNEMTNSMLGYVYSRNNLNKLWDDKSRTVEFVTKAQNQFKTPDSNAGEGGELLLYSFLEGHLKAPKILSKMELKTSPKHYIYGSDGIHLLETAPNNYQLIFGESKMYANIKQGIRSAFDSIGHIKQDRFKFDTWLAESELLKETLDPDKAELLASILLPQPSSASKIKKSNAFGVFIGFEMDVTSYPFESRDATQIENDFRQTADDKISSELHTIEDEIRNRGLGGHHFHIYALPFLKENVNGTVRGIKEARYDIASRLSNKS